MRDFCLMITTVALTLGCQHGNETLLPATAAPLPTSLVSHSLPSKDPYSNDIVILSITIDRPFHVIGLLSHLIVILPLYWFLSHAIGPILTPLAPFSRHWYPCLHCLYPLFFLTIPKGSRPWWMAPLIPERIFCTEGKRVFVLRSTLEFRGCPADIRVGPFKICRLCCM